MTDPAALRAQRAAGSALTSLDNAPKRRLAGTVRRRCGRSLPAFVRERVMLAATFATIRRTIV